MKKTAAILAAAGTALTAASLAHAQDLPETTLNVVGSWSGLSLYKNFEQPFWSEHIPEASNGAITVELTTFDQMGIDGADVFRLLSNGVFDIGSTVADYVVQDAPELEGLDMPLIAPDVETARKIAEAYAPMVDEALKTRFGAHLLSIVPYPGQVVFCNTEISGLADLKGLQIRASGRTTAQFLEGLGAEGITLAFNEVPGALERGVIDCAVTGSLSGYSSGWHEVSTHLLPLPIGGWDHVVTAVNLDRWNALDESVRQFIETEIETNFEDKVWETAIAETQEGVACLTGEGECGRGEAGSMVLVEATEADADLARQILNEQVLPAWADRVGAEWASRWNEMVGSIAGVEAPVEQ